MQRFGERTTPPSTWRSASFPGPRCVSGRSRFRFSCGTSSREIRTLLSEVLGLFVLLATHAWSVETAEATVWLLAADFSWHIVAVVALLVMLAVGVHDVRVLHARMNAGFIHKRGDCM